jgi:hypothetical protein
VHHDIWIPTYLNPNEPNRIGYRWLVECIREGKYRCLPSLLARLENELLKMEGRLSSESFEVLLCFVRSFEQGATPYLREDVMDILQLGGYLKVYQ